MNRSSRLMLGATFASLAASLWSSASGAANAPRPVESPRFPTPSFPPDRVCAVFESEFRTKGGWRTCIVVLDDGRRIDDERPIEAWGQHGWTRLSLAAADRRRALINRRNVVAVTESVFRRTDAPTRDSQVDLVGGTQVSVAEPIGAVRQLLGIFS